MRAQSSAQDRLLADERIDAPTLTVIVPVFNEAATVGSILDRIAGAPYDKQIVVVDDGSVDSSAVQIRDWGARYFGRSEVHLLSHGTNRGKGTAIRTGIKVARGRITVIQDADLEYDPVDYPRLVEPVLAGQADAVYGSRYLSQGNHLPWTANRVCVHVLNVLVRILYGECVSDEATCYKAFRTDLLRRLDLQCERFEFCPEVTAKICRMGIKIHEVPIRYHPRTVSEGKKIRWRDGVEAITTLLYWRFARFRPVDLPRVPRHR